MSAILLANPFAPPPQPAGISPDTAAPLALAPLKGSAASTASGTADSFAGSGNGGGTSKQADSVALFRTSKATTMSRPPDATGRSIIGAQAEDNPFGTNLPKVEMPLPLPTAPVLKQE